MVNRFNGDFLVRLVGMYFETLVLMKPEQTIYVDRTKVLQQLALFGEVFECGR